MISTATPTRPIGDIAKVISGYAFKSGEFTDEGVPVIKIKNIRVGYVDLHEAAYVSSEYNKLASKYHVRPGDLLISLTGSHLTQPNSVVGRVALHRKSNGNCLLNQRAGKIIPHSTDHVDTQYLYYVLSTPLYRRELAIMASGAASQANISPTQVESVKIPLPDLPTQKKIAGILSAYDDLIENNLRRIQILEDMAQSLYREWFVHYRFPGHESTQFKDSPLGPIPQDWEVKTVGEIGKVITGKTPSKKNEDFYGSDMPFVKTPDMHGQVFLNEYNEYLSVAGAESQSNKTVPRNTICVSCIGTIGIISITTEPCQTNQQINSVVLFDEKSREFAFLKLIELRPTMVNLGSAGATMANMNKGKFESIDIVFPSDQLLKRFHRHVGPMFDQIQTLQKKNKSLRQTRDLLLPKLLSGGSPTK